MWYTILRVDPIKFGVIGGSMSREIIAFSRIYGPKRVLVDDEDYEDLVKFKWLAHKKRNTFYACRWDNEHRNLLAMHRQILGFPKGKNVDHKDQNGLNNQKSNLRIATVLQNCMNSIMRRSNKSGYRGVSWCKIKEKWRTQANCKSIGWFDTKEEAARAYDKYVIERFGEFAKPNFPTTPP